MWRSSPYAGLLQDLRTSGSGRTFGVTVDNITFDLTPVAVLFVLLYLFRLVALFTDSTDGGYHPVYGYPYVQNHHPAHSDLSSYRPRSRI